MEARAKAEWDPLKKVFIHRPGIEMFFGLLDPEGSLYERAFSVKGALSEHSLIENALKQEFNIDVRRLKDEILNAADKSQAIRNKLIKKAREVLFYEARNADKALAEFDRNAKYLDNEHFFNILVLNPGIDTICDKGINCINLKVLDKVPLCNLFFMRDQQFVTDKGVVLSRMASGVRRGEVALTKFLWEDVLNVPIALEIKAPGCIEGGEFIPMGKFALVGVGSRTNQEAIDQLLTLDFDYEEIGVVHQPMHPLIDSKEPDTMINMHLDTYFNVPSSEEVIASELLIKHAKVDIYHKEGPGNYVKDDREINLYDYITSKGFRVINLTTLEQMSYASNFLTISNKKILAIEVERVVDDVLNNLQIKAKANPKRYGKLFDQAKADYKQLKSEGQFFPHKKELYEAGIDFYPLILKNLTGGFGGAHCMTCGLLRG